VNDGDVLIANGSTSALAPDYRQDFVFNGNDDAWVPKNTHEFGLGGSVPAWTPENNHDFAFNDNADVWTPNSDTFLDAPSHGQQGPGFGPSCFLSQDAMQPLFYELMPYYPRYAQQDLPRFMSGNAI
jgi:hypothetical protein